MSYDLRKRDYKFIIFDVCKIVPLIYVKNIYVCIYIFLMYLMKIFLFFDLLKKNEHQRRKQKEPKFYIHKNYDKKISIS